MTSSTIIVYHDNCHDGITALWAALKAHPDAATYPGKHGEKPDLIKLTGRDVIIVDFSWKRPELENVKRVAKSLRILDHHKTAQEDLQGFECDQVVFDMNRSGAGIAWDVLVGGRRPAIIDYVEDRDLWKFSLKDSKAVHAYCASFPLDLEHRERLAVELESFSSWRSAIVSGQAILRYHNKLVQAELQRAYNFLIADHEMNVVDGSPIGIVSDLAHELAISSSSGIGCVVRTSSDHISYHLRSVEGGPDVGAIAAAQGGGGHKHASGFIRKCLC